MGSSLYWTRFYWLRTHADTFFLFVRDGVGLGTVTVNVFHFPPHLWNVKEGHVMWYRWMGWSGLLYEEAMLLVAVVLIVSRTYVFWGVRTKRWSSRTRKCWEMDSVLRWLKYRVWVRIFIEINYTGKVKLLFFIVLPMENIYSLITADVYECERCVLQYWHN